MELIASIIGSSGFVGLLTYFFTRQKSQQEVRKLKAEAQGDELDNVLKMQAIIEKINEPLKQEVARLRAELDEIKRLRKEEGEKFQKELTDMKKTVCRDSGCPNRK